MDHKEKTQNNNSPVFIVGVDRSGTTLLSLMLDSHSLLSIPYESKFFIRFYNQSEQFGDLNISKNRESLARNIFNEPAVKAWKPAISLEDIDINQCTSISKCISEIYEKHTNLQGKQIWGDKTPSYITSIHVLNSMFPNARYIHIIRDGRDVASSLVQQWWGPGDFISALRFWQKRVECASKTLRMLPNDRWMELRFEDLVEKPTLYLNKITDFLGIEFESQMVYSYTEKPEQRIGNLIDNIHNNLKSKPSTDQTYKWKKNLLPVDQAIAHEVCRKTLSSFGYEKGRTSHPLKIFRELYHRIYASLAWRLKLNT